MTRRLNRRIRKTVRPVVWEGVLSGARPDRAGGARHESAWELVPRYLTLVYVNSENALRTMCSAAN